MTNVFGKEAKKASPLEYAREKLPPFLILYADKDLLGCDKTPAEKFCKALKDKKVEAEAVEVKDSSHLDIIRRAGTGGSEVQKAIAKFVMDRTK
jgi:acetyl esterase/lipase